MRASPIEVDRPLEAVRGARHVVEGRLRPHLVEIDAECLGGVEGSDNRILEEARKPALVLLLD
jgi:hypothetical protein